MQPSTFINVPSNLGVSRHSDGRPRPPDRLPRALAESGLLGSGGAKDLLVLNRLPSPDDDLPAEETRHASEVRGFTLAAADAVAHAREQGYTPLVCGGNDSVLPGCGLALARAGRYALVYLDAHHGYRRLGHSDAANVAGADLAIVTGTGTDLLTNIEDRRPYFREEDVLTFGFRHPGAGDNRMFEEVRNTRIGLTTLEDGRTLGMEWVGRALADSYEKQSALDGFWVHLDADVLDPASLQAVNRLEPSGLTPEELTTLLARLLRSPRFAGMDVTTLHPDLDPDGEALRTLVDVLNKAFQGRTPAKS